MRICILSSGSSGNATLLVAGETRVLVDCGLSGRETLKRLQAVGEDPTKLDGIVITHEHGDHARGLGALSKSLNVPVYVAMLERGVRPIGDWSMRIARDKYSVPVNDEQLKICAVLYFLSYRA